MIGAGAGRLQANVALFQRKAWTPYEQSLRSLLVMAASDLGCGVKDYILALLAGNRYPSFMDSKYKVHTVLLAYYSDEVNAFLQANKAKLENERPDDITNMYFLSVLSRIAADYNVELKKP